MVERKSFRNPFEPLTPEGTWALGLWFADGNVHYDESGARCSLVQTDDPELIDRIRDIIAVTPREFHRIRIRNRAGSPTVVELWVHSMDFAEILEAHGVHPRKSLNMQWPTWVTKDLASHFVRGLMDGDGTLGMYREYPVLLARYVSGSWDFIEGFRSTIAPVVGKLLPVRSYAKGEAYVVEAWGARARKWCRWMYKGSTMQCRKRSKYDTYVQDMEYRKGKGLPL